MPATSKLRTLLMATLCGSSIIAFPAHAALLSWTVTAGDWHEATNWLPAQVPAPFDQAVINNGGTATIGPGAPVSVSNLNLGADSTDAAGQLVSTSDVSAGSTITIGALSNGLGNTATGQMTVNTANVSGTVRVGVLANADSASVANGTLNIVSGNLAITNSFGIDIGRSSNSQGTANGAVMVDGVLSIATLSPVFAPTLSVGVSSSGDASGHLAGGSIDTAASPLGNVAIGTAGAAGSAIGQVQLGGGVLDTSGNVNIGTALGNNGGFAIGEALMPDVEVIAVGTNTQHLQVGTATALGLLNNLGQGSGSGDASVHQVSGFDSVTVGRALGTHLNGLDAEGRLTIGAGGLQGNAGDSSVLEVGVTSASPNNNQIFGTAASANGQLSSAGGLSGFSRVSIGVNGAAGTGVGSATGSASVAGGDVAIGNQLTIGATALRGDIIHNDNTGTPPVSAAGTFDMTGGTLSLASPGVIAVGQVTVLDSSSAPVVNAGTATGAMTLNGVNLQAPASDLNVGFVLGGFGNTLTHSADGLLVATGGQLNLRDVRVGAGSGQGAQARGQMQLDGADLNARNLAIGSGSGSDGSMLLRDGTASIETTLSVGALNTPNSAAMRGALTLDRAQMTVGGSALIGPVYQGGTGALTLIDASLSVAGNLVIGRSSNQQSLFGEANVWLDSSTITVGDGTLFDIGANLGILVLGTDRGTGYGTIDTGSAALDGHLLVDLSQASVVAGDTFDLIVSNGLGQISGDFLAADAIGLSSDLAARFAIVSDWVNGSQVDIYRMTVDNLRVPEPGSFALVLLALFALYRFGPSLRVARIR